MSDLSDIVDAVSEQLQELRRRAEKAEAERDEYKRMCVRLMEIVDRQSLSYAEAVQVESVERKVGT